MAKNLHMNPFANPKYVTSSFDLQNLLSKCTKCLAITQNANLIVPQENLPEIQLPLHTQKKFFVIVHIPAKGPGRDDANELVGHWVGLAVFVEFPPHKSKCLVIDPANQFHNDTHTYFLIHEFCTKHNLNLIKYNVLFQKSSSLLCGLLILFHVAKMESLSFNGMMHLRTIIKNHNVHFNECYMLAFVQRHFNVIF